jgi:hypothetical protein
MHPTGKTGEQPTIIEKKLFEAVQPAPSILQSTKVGVRAQRPRAGKHKQIKKDSLQIDRDTSLHSAEIFSKQWTQSKSAIFNQPAKRVTHRHSQRGIQG